jgi:hypothetical protein
MTTIVAAAADHDDVVRPGASFRASVLEPQFRDLGVSARFLRGPDARRNQVVRAVSQADVRLFTGVGHGAGDVFKGQDNDPIYLAATVKKTRGIAGRIFHLCACSTAQRLGPALLEAGATAFFGYRKDVLVGDPAIPFYQADAEIDIALAEGATCAEALEQAERAFEEAINLAQQKGDSLNEQYLTQAKEDLVGPSSREPEWGDLHARLAEGVS